jgi:hypothetical protein
MNALTPRQGIPLRPDAAALVADQRRSLHRAIAAKVIGARSREPAHQIVNRAWPDDIRASLIVRAPTTPTTTTAAAALTQTRTSDLLLVAPGSAAAQLFSRCLRLDFDGISQFLVPYVGAHPTPLFVGEGAPIPVGQAALGHATVGPVHKLAFITTLTNELERATPEAASVILGRLLGEAAAKALDLAVFGNAAADATRPAGLLNGVAPLTAAAAGATAIDTAATDIATFAGAFATANINSANMVLITHPKQAWKLRMVSFPPLDVPVLMSIALTPGTVIAVVPEAVASGYEGTSEIEVTQFPTVHLDDSVPLDIASGGTMAVPVMSTWQQDLMAVKLRVRCAWAPLQPGAVQFMTGVNW